MSEKAPRIRVSPEAKAVIAAALAGGARARFVRVAVGGSWAAISYKLALDESAKADDVVIEAAGLRFLADRDELPMVSNLRIEVDDRRGEPRLLLAHPAWAPYGNFQERIV